MITSILKESNENNKIFFALFYGTLARDQRQKYVIHFRNSKKANILEAIVGWA